MTATTTDKRAALRGRVTVALLDVTPLEDDATAWAREKMAVLFDDEPEPGARRLELGWKPWGVFDAADGTSKVLVCNEGVGYLLVDGNDTTDVDLYKRTRQNGRTVSFGMAPSAQLTVSLDELPPLATGETVDLADHIRIFGERLESNLKAMVRLGTDAVYVEARKDAS